MVDIVLVMPVAMVVLRLGQQTSLIETRMICGTYGIEAYFDNVLCEWGRFL